MTRRKVLVLFLVGLVTILGIVFMFVSRNSGLAVSVVALPGDSKIELDGVPIKAGRVKLTPGKHVLKASRQHFDDVQVEIDTANLDTKKIVYLLPGATSPEAIKWLNENPSIQREREAAGGEEAITKQRQLLTQYAVIEKLPYETLDYKIDYAVSASGEVSFTVTLYPLARPSSPDYQTQLDQIKQQANNYLSAHGVDTTAAQIVYTPTSN
jgi:hypothetical protein